MATLVTLYIAFDGKEFKTKEEAEKYNNVNSDRIKKLNFSNIYKDNKEEFAKLLGIKLSDLDNKNFSWSSYNNGDLQGSVIEFISKNTTLVQKQFEKVNNVGDRGDFKPL